MLLEVRLWVPHTVIFAVDRSEHRCRSYASAISSTRSASSSSLHPHHVTSRIRGAYQVSEEHTRICAA
eukprot:3463017-Rhodomonas_salina.2